MNVIFSLCTKPYYKAVQKVGLTLRRQGPFAPIAQASAEALEALQNVRWNLVGILGEKLQLTHPSLRSHFQFIVHGHIIKRLRYYFKFKLNNYFSYNLERFSREIPRYGWAHLPCWKKLHVASGLQHTKSDDFTKHHSLPLFTTSHPLSPPSCLYFLSPFPPSVFFPLTPSFPLSPPLLETVTWDSLSSQVGQGNKA